MKKLIKRVFVLLMVVFGLVGCAPKHFTGRWNYVAVADVQIASSVSDARLEELKEEYGVNDKLALQTAVCDELNEEQTLKDYYLNLNGKNTKSWDPNLNREASWILYQTSETEGFLSFYELEDASQGNPDPSICPSLRYNNEIDVMYVTLKYIAFMVTLTLSR